MAILNETLSALQAEHARLPETDDVGRAAKAAIGNLVYDLITDADAFMAGVRRYAEESTGGHF